MKFALSEEDHGRIREWLKNVVYPDVIAKQRAASRSNPAREALWESGRPYEGASGGGLTYQFTPTTLGLVTKVRYADDYELDLTDYADW